MCQSCVNNNIFAFSFFYGYSVLLSGIFVMYLEFYWIIIAFCLWDTGLLLLMKWPTAKSMHCFDVQNQIIPRFLKYCSRASSSAQDPVNCSPAQDLVNSSWLDIELANTSVVKWLKDLWSFDNMFLVFYNLHSWIAFSYNIFLYSLLVS